MPKFRLYVLPRCVINPPPSPEPPKELAVAGVVAALAGIFVPKLIEAGLTSLGNWLKKAGDKETRQIEAEEILDLYLADENQSLLVNPRLGCVLGVWFDDSPSPQPGDEVAQRLRKEGLLAPTAILKGAFEALIVPSSDRTAFHLETRYFRALSFLDKSKGDPRAYVATLSLSTPSATTDGTVFALGQVDLGKHKPGDAAIQPAGAPGGFPRFRSNLMPWSAISEASKKVHEADTKAGTAAGKGYMPVTVSLTMTETEDGNAFLTKLGEILADNAKTASEEISKRILPAKIAEAEAAEHASADKLYDEELNALLAVREVERELADPANAQKIPELKVKLEIKRRALEAKTRLRKAAGLPDRDMLP